MLPKERNMANYIEFHPITEKKEVYTRHIKRLEKTIHQIDKIIHIMNQTNYDGPKQVIQIINNSTFLGKNIINASCDNLTIRGTFCSYEQDIILHGQSITNLASACKAKGLFLKTKYQLNKELKDLKLTKKLGKTLIWYNKIKIEDEPYCHSLKSLQQVHCNIHKNYNRLLKIKNIIDKMRVAKTDEERHKLNQKFHFLNQTFIVQHESIPRKSRFGKHIVFQNLIAQSKLRIATISDLSKPANFDSAYRALYENGQLYARHLRGLDYIKRKLSEPTTSLMWKLK